MQYAYNKIAIELERIEFFYRYTIPHIAFEFFLNHFLFPIKLRKGDIRTV